MGRKKVRRREGKDGTGPVMAIPIDPFVQTSSRPFLLPQTLQIASEAFVNEGGDGWLDGWIDRPLHMYGRMDIGQTEIPRVLQEIVPGSYQKGRQAEGKG